MKKILFLFILFILIIEADAQLFKRDTSEFDRKKEEVYDGKRYRVHNTYFTFGAGMIGLSNNEHLNFNMGLDLNFHIRKVNLQFGGTLAGQRFNDNKIFNLHLGGGKRVENRFWSTAAYGGISYTSGFFKQTIQDTLLNVDYFSQYGVYACLQAYYKPLYDIGIGVSIFGDYNQRQYMIGARVELYFSGAYRGEKKGRYRKAIITPPSERSE